MGFFAGLFEEGSANVAELPEFLLCIGCALLCGLIFTLGCRFRERFSRSFLETLAMLPAIVSVVIMMVNGNVGTGVAVAGAFSLVRFRSAPGTAKEIGAIFAAMGIGLLCGMGYLGYSLLFTVIIALAFIIYSSVGVGHFQSPDVDKVLRITIPEDLDYSGMFDDLFQKYTRSHRLLQVKTTNMGSMFRLTYQVTLQKAEQEKALIDELRCRNGNLEIMMSSQETGTEEL